MSFVTLQFPAKIRGKPYRVSALYRMVSCGEDNIRFWRVRHGSLRSCPVDIGSDRSLEFTDVCFGHETVDHDKKHKMM